MNSWTTSKEKGAWVWVEVLSRTYKLLGRKFFSLCMYPTAAYYFLFSSQTRAASRHYLSLLHKHTGKEISGAKLYWLTYKHLVEFSFAVVDKVAVWQQDISINDISFTGKEPLQATLRSGKGILFMGAHLGNIEILRAVIDSLGHATVNALTYTEHTPFFNALLAKADPKAHIRLISTANSGPELGMLLREKIDNGEIVASLADRVMPGSEQKDVAVSFLGAKALFPSGPFILAHFLECPVFLVFCFREKKGKYTVIFEPFADTISLPRPGRAHLITEYVIKYVARLEHYCRLYPLQWFNFYRFWS